MAHELDDFKTCKKHVQNNNCAEVKQTKIYTLYSPVLGGHAMNAEVRKLNCAQYYCARNKRDAIRDTRAREIEPRTFLPLRPRPRPSPTRAQCRRHRRPPHNARADCKFNEETGEWKAYSCQSGGRKEMCLDAPIPDPFGRPDEESPPESCTAQQQLCVGVRLVGIV